MCTANCCYRTEHQQHVERVMNANRCIVVRDCPCIHMAVWHCMMNQAEIQEHECTVGVLSRKLSFCQNQTRVTMYREF